MTNKTPNALLKQLLQDVWTDGNLDTLDELITDDYTIIHDPGDPWEGQQLTRKQFCQRIHAIHAQYPNRSFMFLDCFSAPERACVSWLMEYICPHSGQHKQVPGMTIFHFRHHRISGHAQILDRSFIHNDAVLPACRAA